MSTVMSIKVSKLR